MGDLSSQLGKVHVTPPQQLRPKPKPAQQGTYLQINSEHGIPWTLIKKFDKL